MLLINSITREGFEPFGTVLEFPPDCNEPFCIIDTEENSPWRVAVFRYSNHEVSRMENHPSSKESFEPLQGITILVVAEKNKPEQYKGFLLDKPVCLKKGIWHQVLALTPEAQVKITENLEVSSEFYDFDKPLRVVLTAEF
jgi:ureidoglycolate hydrolase